MSTSSSVIPSIHHVTSLSVIPSVCQSTCPSVELSVHHMTSPSVLPICLSYDQSIHPPVPSSSTGQYVMPPIRPTISLSDCMSMSDCLYGILPCPSDCPSLSDHSSTIFTSLSYHPSPPDHLYSTSQSLSACLSPSGSLTKTTTHLTACPSSTMIQHMQHSSQSLGVMNGEQSRKAKKFCFLRMAHACPYDSPVMQFLL